METHLSRSKSDFRCPYLVNFFFIQCLGDGKITWFFAKAFVFLKNITMFLWLVFCNYCMKSFCFFAQLI